MPNFSPLRYPGGKSSFTPFIAKIIEHNKLDIKRYYELYAGGSAVALEMLISGFVESIVLNDADIHIFSFWSSILKNPDGFIKKLLDTPVNIKEWSKQKQIYNRIGEESELEIGFASFFLNRTNRSGILAGAGPIGGFDQKGNYKIDARFNKKALIEKIELISLNSNRIKIHNDDAIVLLKKLKGINSNKSFIFLDPPYVSKGKKLYLNYYKEIDHKNLRDCLIEKRDKNWIVSYDNNDFIKNLYRDFKMKKVQTKYSLQSKKMDAELVFASNGIQYPKNIV